MQRDNKMYIVKERRMKHWILGMALMMAGTGMTQAQPLSCAPGSSGCYQQVMSEPVYQHVREKVMVQPPHIVTRVLPAERYTMPETVMVRPPLSISRMEDARYTTIAHPVLIEPERREWRVRRDAHGRKIGCWVTIPARYGRRTQSVLISPPRVYTQELPPIYETRQKVITSRPARVLQETLAPPVYAIQERNVLVQPSTPVWVPAYHNSSRGNRVSRAY
jgi:hypothetical protein